VLGLAASTAYDFANTKHQSSRKNTKHQKFVCEKKKTKEGVGGWRGECPGDRWGCIAIA
jgi:hypothetical protein